ncbi:hypothetical protein ABT369_28745 [Dactylosporangium sp. NPDC000244]|uniref:hypothetical protein n=1 Tax=Dactylosporangium sp. NPDC000244 TaxID=3154365 RepID=UPI003324AC14
MTRTTPPRPLDVTAGFPELNAHTTTATRLHPRPGAPAVTQSSIGGPLLWPAGEPWPVCDVDDHDDPVPLPTPMIPVAQVYRHDAPDFAGPDGTDVLQVLWCPLDHLDEGYNPLVRVFWRRAAGVTRVLAEPPAPAEVHEEYVPAPCVVHPERVREYDYIGSLPGDLAARVRERFGSRYQYDLSLAPGWKLGGFANWSLTDPLPMDCEACGAPMTLLFTAASSEGPASWQPLEDAPVTPTGIVIGRGYSLYVFRCPASFEHPVATAMQ